MKKHSVILFCCFVLLSACRKDLFVKPANYYYKGIVYDSIRGVALPGQVIHRRFDARPIQDFTTITTDSYGVFNDNLNNYFSGMHGYEINRVFLWTDNDSLAGKTTFSIDDLTRGDTLETDIYMSPCGYISLQLHDSTLSDSITIFYSNSTDGNSSIEYNARNNTYADTALMLKVYGNSQVNLSIDFRPSLSHSPIFDTLFVPQRDTVFKQISY